MTKREKFLNNCLVGDFESTSLELDVAEIIQQGFSAYEKGTWNVVYEHLHDSDMEVPPEASMVNHLTSDKLKGYPKFSYALFAKGHKDKDTIFVFHNSTYDVGILEKYVDSSIYEDICSRTLCTYRMMKHLYANDDSFTMLKLAYLYYRLSLNVGDNMNFHSAGFDSCITGLVFNHILDEVEKRGIINPKEDYFPQLKEWSEQIVPIEKINFGKYKGMPLKVLPEKYLEWLSGIDKCDPDSLSFDPDLTYAVLSLIDGDF